ncbi:MAG TPA: hypothetical protein VKA73_08290 [Rubrobacter sp.]|nr:hypothetical protein [Rubrobacter sp.]
MRYPTVFASIEEPGLTGGVPELDALPAVVGLQERQVPFVARVVLGAPNDAGSDLFERCPRPVERRVKVDVYDGARGAVGPGSETAGNLVGNAVALQDADDPREGFPHPLRFVDRRVHHVHPAV